MVILHKRKRNGWKEEEYEKETNGGRNVRRREGFAPDFE